MKKLTLTIIFAAFGLYAVNAQELTSKKGVPILPEAGDYAVGINASPIFTFFGDFTKINSGTPFVDNSSWNFIDANNFIMGKYFVDAETAYRFKVRIGLNSTSDKEYVQQDGQSDPLVTVEDKQKVSTRNIYLGAGMEKRRGKGRLQGFYGGEAGIFLAGGKEKYEYGNAFSSTNTFPNRTNFGTNVSGSSYITENKTGGTFGLGVRGFVGAEYFIFPKISVGGEFGWGLTFASTGDGEVTVESWDAANNTVKTTTTKTGGGGTFGFDTDNFGGCIYMLFHF